MEFAPEPLFPHSQLPNRLARLLPQVLDMVRATAAPDRQYVHGVSRVCGSGHPSGERSSQSVTM